jgi:hypothetical protein
LRHYEGNEVRKSDRIDVAKALREVHCEFLENELAYLAATGKVESPIRNKLAFNLQRSYEAANYFVAREWSNAKIDIAVVNYDDRPVCLIELKAMYTFDAVANARRFVEDTIKDEIKARGRDKDAVVYSLLLSAHTGDRLPAQLSNVIKYRRIDAMFAKYPYGGKEAAFKAVRNLMVGRNLEAEDCIPAGKAFGQEWAIHYWLVSDAVVPGTKTSI